MKTTARQQTRVGLGVVTVAALLAVPGPAGAAAFASCGSGLLGDVTGDGTVNVIDAQQIARWSVGLTVNATVESRISTHGDVNDDGNVNIIDAQQIARWSVGLSTSFAIGDPLPPCEGIRVTTSTTGEDLDPDGYSVLLDGVFASEIGVNSTVDLADAGTGEHSVTLQGLAANCGITNGTATRTVTVVEGEAVSVDYQVECTGSDDGVLEVRNTTDGGGSPPGGSYAVSLDGADPVSMPVDGSVRFEGIALGSHTVTLGNLGSCVVDGGSTKTVQVESGLNILHFSVTCSGQQDP